MSQEERVKREVVEWVRRVLSLSAALLKGGDAERPEMIAAWEALYEEVVDLRDAICSTVQDREDISRLALRVAARSFSFLPLYFDAEDEW